MSFAHDCFCLVEKCQSAVGERMQCRIKCRNMEEVFNLTEFTKRGASSGLAFILHSVWHYTGKLLFFF